MKKLLFLVTLAIALFACNNKTKTTATTAPGGGDNTEKISPTPSDLPYTASYSSQFNEEGISDADLKMVLMSYKDWEAGNMENVATYYTDSLYWESTSGDTMNAPKGDIMKKWKTYRDSLSSITIDMQAWHKMHSVDKNENFIVTWYKEIDTYKSGKADSAFYQDINQVKEGKICMLLQYKRPKK
jgi:hypothetical protein